MSLMVVLRAAFGADASALEVRDVVLLRAVPRPLAGDFIPAHSTWALYQALPGKAG